MKKRMLPLLLLAALLLALTGCGEETLLDKNDPVTVNFWHVYGEQSGSPMDVLVQEFNHTVGQEQGVRVQVTNLSSASKIGGFLKEAQNGGDLQEMPDLFTCHISDATALGEENLVDWHDWFTQECWVYDLTTGKHTAHFPPDGENGETQLIGSACWLDNDTLLLAHREDTLSGENPYPYTISTTKA